MLEQAHETVEKLLAEMRPVLTEVGCKRIRIAAGDFELKHYNDAYDWLHRIYLSDEYALVKSVYDRVPPHAWVNYRALGVRDLWEQRAMAGVGGGLLQLWRTKKPRLFKNDKPVRDPENDEEAGVRSEETGGDEGVDGHGRSDLFCAEGDGGAAD